MNDNDPNLARGLVSVHQHRQVGGWTHSRTTTYGGPPETWATIAEATMAAVAWIKGNPQHTVRGVTGHPDRKVLREAGIAYVDSRRDRRSKSSRAKDFSIAKARAAAEGRPWEDQPPKTTAHEAPPPMEKAAEKTPTRTAAQLAALAAARTKRAAAKERTAPEGYRSVEHFLDSVREEVGRRAGGTVQLANYLRVNESSVRRWIKREKIPLQATIDAINRWLISKGAGL